MKKLEKLKQEFRKLNKELGREGERDPEELHIKMDNLLLEFVGADKELINLYREEPKWYA